MAPAAASPFANTAADASSPKGTAPEAITGGNGVAEAVRKPFYRAG